MSGRSAKRKGTAGERELRDRLIACGWGDARRTPMSGAIIGLPHDVTASCGPFRFGIEVKRRRELPKTFEGWMKGSNVLALRADRGEWRFYIAQDLFEDFLRFIAEKK